MDTQAVLTEVVQPRPDLVLFRAVPGSTAKAPIVLIDHSVNTLLVPSQVILSAEAIALGASVHIALVWSVMSEPMLPETVVTHHRKRLRMDLPVLRLVFG